MSNAIQLNSLSSVLDGRELTKQLVEELSCKLLQPYLDGELLPEDGLVQAEFLIQSLTNAKDKLKELCLDNPRIDDKGITINGVVLKVKESGVQYDYSNTQSWIQMKSKEDAIAQERKILESQLKTLSKDATMIDRETGEIIILNPPVKRSKTTIEIKLK